MIDLQSRWAALFDSVADDDAGQDTLAQATASTAPSDIVPVHEAPVYGASGTLADEVQDAADDAIDDEQVTVDFESNDDLPVYETTRGQIEAWHVWGEFYTLRDFLYLHDWNFYHKIFCYDEFKVGLDRDKTCQRATFAVDYDKHKETVHYLAFDFDETTGQAKDYAEACRVLAKINALRKLRD